MAPRGRATQQSRDTKKTKIVNEYDQDIPKSQAADIPMALRI